MLVALPYCATDQGLAKGLLQWMGEIGTYLHHDLLLFRESEATAIPHPSGWRSVVTVTYKNPYNSLPGTAQKRWAMATSMAFSSVARHIEYHQNEPFLFLEPDCVVFRGWETQLPEEYTRTKKPFMGFLVPGVSDSPSHMSGVGYYPSRVIEHAGQALMLDEQWPWDLSAADAIRPKAHFTDLISHIWKRKPYTSLEEFYSENSRETVLFHSQKTPALIELLRQQRNGGDAKSAQEKLLNTLSVSGAEKVQAPSAPIKPWASLTPKEKKLRRQAQMAKARAAKVQKNSVFEGEILEEEPHGILIPPRQGWDSIAQPAHVSETDTCRAIMSKWCLWPTLDVGAGGSPITDNAITFDKVTPYTDFHQANQIVRGDCRDLSMFCDEAFATVFSSHLIEDISYSDLIPIIKEWRRVLKTGGYLCLNAPNQQKFLAHCAASGQPTNNAHVEMSFSYENFSEKVLAFTGAWKLIFKEENHGPYSWLACYFKV